MMKEDSTQTGGIIRWGLKTWEGDMAPCLCSMSAHMGSKGSAIPQILLPCSAAVFSFKYSENYVTINSILTAAERVDAFEFMCDSILWRDIDWRKIKKKEKEKLVWSPALLCLTSCQTKEKTLSPPADKIWIALPHLITCYYDYLRHLAWKLRGDLEHCVSYNSIESEQIICCHMLFDVGKSTHMSIVSSGTSIWRVMSLFNAFQMNDNEFSSTCSVHHLRTCEYRVFSPAWEWTPYDLLSFLQIQWVVDWEGNVVPDICFTN